MINVNILKQNNRIARINVTGHANFAEAGEDLVCAGVSSILFGALNGLDHSHGSDTKLEVLDNDITIEVIHDSKQLQNLLEFLLVQLQTVEQQYQQYIKINTEV